MDKKIESYSLAGKWDWINTSVNNEDEWQILELFAPSDRIWDFRENGVMESVHYERACYRATYKWDEQKMTLSLNGHKLDREGNKYALVYERYNIFFLNPDELYLYDTEEYIGIQGSGLRLHFKRSESGM